MEYEKIDNKMFKRISTEEKEIIYSVEELKEAKKTHQIRILEIDELLKEAEKLGIKDV